MADKSNIEWTEATWNPIVGCSIVSKGCTNCYAMKQAHRIQAMTHASGKQSHYDGTTKLTKGGPVWTGKVALAPDRKLLEPLRWSKPRTIFVNSMSDLFHEDVPDEWIDRAFAIMALCPRHTFQVLTKRAERMRTYMSKRDGRDRHIAMTYAALMSCTGRWNTPALDLKSWPLPNVWLGVSAEDQTRADERIPHLVETPAARRFVSAEPLLGPIDFGLIKDAPHSGINALAGLWVGPDHEHRFCEGLDWIIVGGESGTNARPMHPDWARSIRDQCQAAGVSFFFKQWGEHVTGYLDGEDFHVDEEAHGSSVNWNGTARCHEIPGESGHYGRVGKRAAGRRLDGREHNEMPEVRP